MKTDSPRNRWGFSWKLLLSSRAGLMGKTSADASRAVTDIGFEGLPNSALTRLGGSHPFELVSMEDWKHAWTAEGWARILGQAQDDSEAIREVTPSGHWEQNIGSKN